MQDNKTIGTVTCDYTKYKCLAAQVQKSMQTTKAACMHNFVYEIRMFTYFCILQMYMSAQERQSTQGGLSG